MTIESYFNSVAAPSLVFLKPVFLSASTIASITLRPSSPLSIHHSRCLSNYLSKKKIMMPTFPCLDWQSRPFWSGPTQLIWLMFPHFLLPHILSVNYKILLQSPGIPFALPPQHALPSFSKVSGALQSAFWSVPSDPFCTLSKDRFSFLDFPCCSQHLALRAHDWRCVICGLCGNGDRFVSPY